MHGVLFNTLAALHYILIAVSPQPTSYASTVPVANPIQVSVYLVKKGETLTDIAEKRYGSKDYWTTIWNDNPNVVNPSDIKAGLSLKMRTTSPILVESVSGELMTRLLNSPENKPLDPSLAFATAEGVHPEAHPTESAPKELVSNSYKQNSVPTPPSNFDAVYQAAGSKFGVPWQILYGIHLTETGLRNGRIYNGSGSGAEGPMQFMPGTFRAYAIDGNGDGVLNIDDAVDAIYTAANFIAKHGSVMQALYSYGGNTSGTLAAACQRGYCL